MKKPDPKVEWGFFAITPRIVRTQYKELSHTEKWLYVCLKDLCGDKGMCYRTLKALSQETDLSTGNLSTGIRHLHEAGLIHAEKKRRSALPTAKEVWHISVVDIWQANVEHCSNFERSTENVQEMNDNVQNLNEPTPKRSISEPQRSNFVDRRITVEEETITEEITVEEEGTGAFAPTPAPADALREKVDGLIDTAARLRAIRLQQEQAELEETVKRPTVRIGGKDATVHDAGDRDVDRADAGLSRDDRTGVVPARGAAADTRGLALAGEGHPSGQAQSGTATVRKTLTVAKVPKRPKAAPTPAPKGPPVMPAEDAEWTTRTCLQLFDAWRGAYLIGKFEQMKASTCAKELVAQYSRAEVEGAKAKMDRDKYWMERGGADVCNVAGQIHRYCRRGKAPVQAAIDDDPYSFANILKRQEEEQQRAGARGN